MLAERYGWPAEVVARMTPAQQLMYLGGGADGSEVVGGRAVARFESVEAAMMAIGR